MRLPRRLIFLGIAIPHTAILAELIAVGRPPRFPDWYPAWFWIPATLFALVLAVNVVLFPDIRNIQAAAAASATWSLFRAFLNLARDAWGGVIGCSLWLGIAVTIVGVGIAAGTTGPLLDAEREAAP